MGFFNKLKSMANTLTGGAADVSISIEGTDAKSPITVHITAKVGDSPLKIDKVYLLVKSIESIDIPSHHLNNNSGFTSNFDNDNNNNHHHQNVDVDYEIFAEKEFKIADAQTLDANQTYNWTYEFTLNGGNIKPTYHGKFAEHKWVFQVGLDARGNDPDSGWQAFELT